MQVEAIYNQGKPEHLLPLRPGHQRIRVTGEVPDDAIGARIPCGLPAEVVKMAEEMAQEPADVLNAPLAPDGELPVLKAKQLARAEAFALGENIRSMR